MDRRRNRQAKIARQGARNPLTYQAAAPSPSAFDEVDVFIFATTDERQGHPLRRAVQYFNYFYGHLRSRSVLPDGWVRRGSDRASWTVLLIVKFATFPERSQVRHPCIMQPN